MATQPNIIPAKPRRLRKQRLVSSRSAQPLVLQSANYQDGSSLVDLTFDRAVNITAYDGTQLTVQDGSIAMANFDGTLGAELVAPNVVRIVLEYLGPDDTGVVVLNATALTGIVADDDAGTWAGVTNYPL